MFCFADEPLDIHGFSEFGDTKEEMITDEKTADVAGGNESAMSVKETVARSSNDALCVKTPSPGLEEKPASSKTGEGLKLITVNS